jgi:hypothetical protein
LSIATSPRALSPGAGCTSITKSSDTRWTDPGRLRPTIAACVLACLAAPEPAAAASDYPAGYRAHHTYAELRAELREIAGAYPGIVSLRSLGRSYEGRKLFVLKISDNVATDESEPEVYVDGGIHGHEHLSTEQALALIRWLVEGFGSDPRTTAIIDSAEIWIAPLVNPDGAVFDISEGRFHRWRKNRQPNADGSKGTDINRNFGYMWAGPGSSADPSDAFYRGTRAWSTPEARRIRDFVGSRVVASGQKLALALTIHSHGEFVMYPFGWTREEVPPDMRPSDRVRLEALAEGIAQRNGYRAVQAGKLYRSSGTFMDWAYAKHRILALTLEMAPAANVEDGWYVHDADIPVELERNRDALLWFLEQAITLA